MNQETKPHRPECSPPVADANVTCDECGAFGAFTFVDVKLCARCYAEKGSCCPEFGKDDLWKAHERTDDSKPQIQRSS